MADDTETTVQVKRIEFDADRGWVIEFSTLHDGHPGHICLDCTLDGLADAIRLYRPGTGEVSTFPDCATDDGEPCDVPRIVEHSYDGSLIEPIQYAIPLFVEG